MRLDEVFSGTEEAVEYWQGSTPDAQLYMLGCLILRVLRVAEPLAASVGEMQQDQAEVVAVLQEVADLIDPRRDTHQAPQGEPNAAPPALPSPVAAPAAEQLVTPEASAEQPVSTSPPADAADAANAANAEPPGRRDRRRKRAADAAE